MGILRLRALTLCLIAVQIANGQSREELRRAREKMVEIAVYDLGITNERILDALRKTPRHLFVPASQRKFAYLDMALPIGEGQTISPPFVVASMTNSLDPKPTDRVLEIGTGSGYQAAVLSHLVAEVYSIEIVKPLGVKAQKTLRRQKLKNVFTKIGDGFQGWAEHAPFDKIIVTCSPERVPAALAQQLREGGRMVVPLGERYQQTMYLLKKKNGKLIPEPLEPTFFVPMTGRAEQLRRIQDSGIPSLLNGGFEIKGDGDAPRNWYYVRGAKVKEADDAPSGSRVLYFENDIPGQSAQALQAIGLDGIKYKGIKISLSLTTDDVNPGRSTAELAKVDVSFFDKRQAPVGAKVMGPWYGTAKWVRFEKTIPVPTKAKLAVIAIGLFGGTGKMSIDDITIQPIER